MYGDDNLATIGWWLYGQPNLQFWYQLASSHSGIVRLGRLLVKDTESNRVRNGRLLYACMTLYVIYRSFD